MTYIYFVFGTHFFKNNPYLITSAYPNILYKSWILVTLCTLVSILGYFRVKCFPQLRRVERRQFVWPKCRSNSNRLYGLPFEEVIFYVATANRIPNIPSKICFKSAQFISYIGFHFEMVSFDILQGQISH